MWIELSKRKNLQVLETSFSALDPLGFRRDTDTFKKHDLDETTKRNTCLCYRSSRCFPNCLKDVGTNVNWNFDNEITQKLCSSKIYESGVRQWVEVGEYDQL